MNNSEVVPYGRNFRPLKCAKVSPKTFAIFVVLAYVLLRLAFSSSELLPPELPKVWSKLSSHFASPKQKTISVSTRPLCSSWDPTITRQSDPYPLESLPPGDYSTLINVKDFKFLTRLNCGSKRHLVVAVVHSAPGNVDKRRSIRSTWGTRIKTFFMIGEPNSVEQAVQLNKEITEYRDIVQGSVVDSYRNLTYKHVMALKWVTYWCRNATYVLKSDDDMFVHAGNLYRFLRQNLTRRGVRRLMLCRRHNGDIVDRSFRTKYRVSRYEYPYDYYPLFCAGAAILYSPDVVFKLYSEAQRTPFFWIDDILITGTIARAANITISDIGGLLVWEGTCHEMINTGKFIDDLLICVTTHPDNLTGLWRIHNLTEPSFVISDIR